MKTLISLPPNAVAHAHEFVDVASGRYFCTSDPADGKLGSGGGTIWLLRQLQEKEKEKSHDFCSWLSQEKRILIHAGGQSRRLPAYAPSGKVFIPVAEKWGMSRSLLDLQLPFYQSIMQHAPTEMHTLVASGDVFLYMEKSVPVEVPPADVVCFAIQAPASQCTRHGVFVTERSRPGILNYMLQKPSEEELALLPDSCAYLMDTGLWLLSDRAVELLRQRSGSGGNPVYYDLYSDFGKALGEHPSISDKEVNALSVAVVPLTDGRFYHYGTNAELLSSTQAVLKLEGSKDKTVHHQGSSDASVTVLNSMIDVPSLSSHKDLWIENSHIAHRWKVASCQIITGVPCNDWQITLPEGMCLDIVPIGESSFAVRPYGFSDTFRGGMEDASYLEMPLQRWLQNRNVAFQERKDCGDDIQQMKLFPVTDSMEELELLIRWMTTEPRLEEGYKLWQRLPRFSADELSFKVNLSRLAAQRTSFEAAALTKMNQCNREDFYLLDLEEVAHTLAKSGLPLPEKLSEGDKNPVEWQIGNRMLRSRVCQLRGEDALAKENNEEAFALLREAMLRETLHEKVSPCLHVHADQIVWARCPVRIDVAGGWTDTPPYSLYEGGNVVNLAVELNGQPPLQVYVKSCREPHIVLRSIDMGAMEVIDTYEQLQDYTRIGSPFSIPKAALVLAGFSPLLQKCQSATLKEALLHFGSGLEITLLAAIPAGSGMGTSSLLAAAVLGALNDFCGLEWDRNQICSRTLVLEQLLTTGGGWQDQYGGVLHGVKLLQTQPGFIQCPVVSWLPDMLFMQPEYRPCHLLYYTGLTRTAKNILGEIVQKMFLNSKPELGLLADMKQHALEVGKTIQRGDFAAYGQLVRRSWEYNKRLDAGTAPPQVENIIRLVEDYTLGLKLAGAGGGGYLYMVAKDMEAARRIRGILTAQAPNDRARFVEMSLSANGFQVTRS